MASDRSDGPLNCVGRRRAGLGLRSVRLVGCAGRRRRRLHHRTTAAAAPGGERGGTQRERHDPRGGTVPRLAHLDVDDDHRDVVGPAVMVGRLDQPLRRLAGVVELAQDRGHLVASHFVGQAIRAEHHPVAGAELELPHVGLHLGRYPEGPGEDVALGMDRRLLLRHLTVAHPLFGQAVVGGDLGHLALGEDVGPGVPDVGQREHVPALRAAHQRHGGQCGPHPPEVGVELALLPHGGVRLREGLAQPVHGRCPFEGAVQRLDGNARRHLAADVTAHAVGDRVQVRALERQILVDGADPPHVGGGPRPQHRQRETSKTVEPIWSRSPLPSRTAFLICSELTKVPLVEPRSSTQSWSLRRKRRAWSVDV